jgi:sulfide:quinone oxidoreductase
MTEGRTGTPKVLIVGGGIAGLEATLALRALCGTKVDVQLLSPRTTYTYRPLAVAEPFGLTERVKINLSAFALSQDIGFQTEELDRVERDGRRLWSTNGTGHEYDYLILATGALRQSTIPGAISFVGFEGVNQFEHLLHRIGRSEVARVAFTAGAHPGWFLPMYELALMTAEFAEQQKVSLELTIVTPESSPLAAFGGQNSADVAHLLEQSNIDIETGAYPISFEDGVLTVKPEGVVEVDEVVALPALKGPEIQGLPADENGFVPVDESCRIQGCEREFAAGDVTNFPVKQGGIAAQMADAVVKAIAVDLGLMGEASAFRPTLDGTLLTGTAAHHLRQSLVVGTAESRLHQLTGSWIPLWKVNAPFLSDYLAAHIPVEETTARIDADDVSDDDVSEGLELEWERRVVGY